MTYHVLCKVEYEWVKEYDKLKAIYSYVPFILCDFPIR